MAFPSTKHGLQELKEKFHRAKQGQTDRDGGDSIERPSYAYANKKFKIKKVKNDEVEKELGWAKAGTRGLPADFQGIHWLDQYHKSSIAQDPAWIAQVPIKHVPSEETVVCFGDAPAEWNEETQTLENVAAYGGEKGHWTMKDGAMGEIQMNNAILTRMTGEFEFSENQTKVKVIAKIKVPVLGKWLSVPDNLFKMEMFKQPWGFNRVTTLGPDLPNTVDHNDWLQEVMPKYFMQLLQVGEDHHGARTGGAMQYPVLQIIDGNGNRTKYYDEYLKFANEQCTHQLVGVDASKAEDDGNCFAGCVVA